MSITTIELDVWGFLFMTGIILLVAYIIHYHIEKNPEEKDNN